MPISSSSKKQNIIPSLDGVRGIAVLSVVVFHSVLLCGFQHLWWSPLVSRGWVGVEIFFVLSGFLITQILVASKAQPRYWVNFLARRALRIFPAYYLSLALIWLFVPYASEDFANSTVRGELGLYLLYLQNWKIAFNYWPDWAYIGHFWSLAVEEQFYLAWPLVVLLTKRAALARVCVYLIAGSLIFVMLLKTLGNPGLLSYVSTFSQLYALCSGCLLAISLPTLRGIDPHWLWPAATVIVVFCGLVYFNLLVVSGTAFIILLVATDSAPKVITTVLGSRILRWYGKYSYGIYLLHYPFIGLIIEHYGESIALKMNHSPTPTAVIFTLVILGLSSIAAQFQFWAVENRFLLLKRYFEPQKRVT